MSSPTFVPAGDMERVVYDADQDGIVDNSETLDGIDSTGFARSTSAAQTIWVDKAATGAGTGVDKTNAFTTVTAAVNSLPAIINHAVTIKIVKGSTAYAETVILQRVVAAGSLTFRGEYYYYGTNASSKTGKFDLGTGDTGYADRAQIEAGDTVWMTKWSGTVSASTPSESIIDTVASVSGAEVTLTTNTTKELNTTWSYQIVKTEINNVNVALAVFNTNALTVVGLKLVGSVSGIFISGCLSPSISVCHLDAYAAGGQVVKIVLGTQVTVFDRNLITSAANGEYGLHAVSSTVISTQCVVNLTGGATRRGIIADDTKIHAAYFHIMAADVGELASSGGVIINTATLNAGTTPKTPANWAATTDGSYVS